MALLEVHDLVVGYGRFPVLHGIDFVVEEGEVCVLLGLNGAGKTTTVSTIAGLLRPTSGRVAFDGRSLGRRSPSARVKAGIALCPEGRRVFPRLTVEQNLRLGSWVQRRRPRTVRRQLELVLDYFPRLDERADQVAGTLSGGEQQMLAMARALMLNPDVLLLDEPSMGLAPRLVAEVFATIARLKEARMTMLLVEQFAAAALEVADFGYVMENGRLSASGAAAALKNDPAVRAAYLGAAH